jgi:hypothetical protein
MKGYFITCIDRCVKLQQISQVQWVCRYASKDIRFGVEACALMLQAVEQLADAVQVTMGPKVHFVSLWALRKCIVERETDRYRQSQPMCVWFESGISVCSFFFLWYYSRGEML